MAPGCLLVLAPWANPGLTGKLASDKLALVLSCKLVFYFSVGGERSLRGRNRILPYVKSDFSAHISVLERPTTLTSALALGRSLLALDVVFLDRIDSASPL